jgi:hypothetical protein
MYSIILLESILLTIVLQISIRASSVQQEMWAYLRAWSPSCGQRLLSSRSVGYSTRSDTPIKKAGEELMRSGHS